MANPGLVLGHSGYANMAEVVARKIHRQLPFQGIEPVVTPQLAVQPFKALPQVLQFRGQEVGLKRAAERARPYRELAEQPVVVLEFAGNAPLVPEYGDKDLLALVGANAEGLHQVTAAELARRLATRPSAATPARGEPQ